MPISKQHKYSNFALVKRLWAQYICSHLRLLLSALALMMVVAGTNSLQPILLETVFDKVLDATNQQNSFYVNIIPLSIIFLFAVQSLANYGSTILIARLGFRIVERMQRQLYEHFMHHDIGMFQKNRSGELMSRITTEVLQMQEAVSGFFITFVRQGLTFAGMVGVMLYQSWQLTLICLGVFLFAIYPVLRITRRLKKLGFLGHGQAAALLARLNESLLGIKTVKAYCQEDAEIERTSSIMREYFRIKYKSVRVGGLSAPVLELLAGTSIALVIWSAASGELAGINSKGELLSFIAALIMASKPMKALNGLNNIMQNALAGAERYFRMIDLQPKIARNDKAKMLKVAKGEIEFENVNFSYGTDREVIKSLNLHVPAGKRVAIVGHSGSGKSTLVNLLMRFYEIDFGSIKIDGQDISKFSVGSLRKAIGLVSQEVFLFSDSVLQNIAYGKTGATMDEVVAAATKAEAHEFISKLPQAYDTNAGEAGSFLSGGQRQRIAIARAFLKDAPILVLDEATSALDPLAEREIQKTLDSLMRDKTTIIIAHRLSTVQNADLIYVLESGNVVESGTHAQLLKKSAKYAKMFAA